MSYISCSSSAVVQVDLTQALEMVFWQRGKIAIGELLWKESKNNMARDTIPDLLFLSPRDEPRCHCYTSFPRPVFPPPSIGDVVRRTEQPKSKETEFKQSNLISVDLVAHGYQLSKATPRVLKASILICMRTSWRYAPVSSSLSTSAPTNHQ